MDADEALDELVVQFVEADTVPEILSATVEVAGEILPADTCEIVAADEDELVVLARAPGDRTAGRRSFPIHKDLFGRTTLIGKSHVFDDLSEVRGVTAPEPNAAPRRELPRSLLLVPIDEVGVFLGTAREPGAFDASDREWAEQLVSCASLAMDAASDVRTDGDSTDRLDRVANILSHEFTGPLGVARGSLELAEETDDSEHFERARSALDRIENLVDGLETLARTGGHIGQPDLVELRTVVEEAWPAIETKQASLEVVGSRPIVADRNALVLLLTNLFSNAIAHAGPTVTVRVGGLDTGFFVGDDGPGIPRPDREQIFEWGYSSSADHKGIGLAIVDQISESHGWEVSVTESSDGGARFEFTGVADAL